MTFLANDLAAKASISPNTQVTLIDKRVTSFLMFLQMKIQSNRLEQIGEEKGKGAILFGTRLAICGNKFHSVILENPASFGTTYAHVR